MPIERIRACAQLSIRRGLGFALLAVGTTVVGFSWNLILALEVGAALCLLVCVILFFRALEAPTRDYRRTEVWILLDKRHGLPEERAQRTIGTILQDLYRHYAEWMLGAAGVQWLGSVLARLT